MEISDVLPILLNVVAIIGLMLLSQVFTGLNIGLFSLDTAQLQVLIDVRNKDETAMKNAKYARRILPLRKTNNLLLCTILLGNTAVNAIMAVFLSSLAGGLLGWLITTVIIVLFCEIIPQTVCTRHGLFLGAVGAPILRIAMCLFYPITKPYAIVLDFVFPQRENLLDRSQLRSLVEYQKSAAPGILDKGQAEMLIGALGIAQRTVEEVMVPLDNAFKIQLETILDYELAASVVRRGFSRFPVVDAATGQVAGILHCKDLLKQRFLGGTIEQESIQCPSNRASARRRPTPTAAEFLATAQNTGQVREVFACGRATTLMTMLAEFKKRPHMAVVTDSEHPGETPDAKHIGIVTLHNILESILQASITDEQQTEEDAGRQAGTLRLFDRRMADHAEPLGPNEAVAVATFLSHSQPAVFSESCIGHGDLIELISKLKPMRPAKRSILYDKSAPSTFGTLVLQGAIKVVSGEEGFESTLGPWSCLGLRALEPLRSPGSMEQEGRELGKLQTEPIFSPDFTATIVTDGCLILRIERADYIKASLQSGPLGLHTNGSAFSQAAEKLPKPITKWTL